MPLTFAHPAAAIPLLRPLGRFGALSALIIGSVVPDFWRFLPFGVTRGESHSLFALLWFCLPVGLAVYLLFHSTLKGPLLALMPGFVFVRLGGYVLGFQSLPRYPWMAVMVSLFVGSFTHIVWDAFTHSGTTAAEAFPALHANVFSIGEYPVYVFKLLQHGTAAVGLLLMAWWAWRWLRTASLQAATLPVMLEPSQRLAILAAILVAALATALWYGTQALAMPSSALPIQKFVRHGVFYGFRALVAGVMIYCAGWHLVRIGKWVRALHQRSSTSGLPPVSRPGAAGNVGPKRPVVQTGRSS